MAETSTFLYVKLTKDIYVPSEWPLSGIDRLVITVARKIIRQNNSISSILQVNDIPAKLVTREDNIESKYLFEKVSKAETVGADLYEIVLPKEEASIRRRTLSGNSFIDESWPDYAVSVSTKANKISYYLMPPRLESKMAEYFAVKNTTTSTRAYLNISNSKTTYAKIHWAYVTSFESKSTATPSLFRTQSWTSVASPQKQQQIQERKSSFEQHISIFELDKKTDNVTVLRKGLSDQSVLTNK